MEDKPVDDKIFFKKRMSVEKRREQIIKTARRLFSERGFRGTTTRELAKAAGISEALLFRHFASKLDLYRAMLEDWIVPSPDDQIYEIVKLELGPERMIAGIYNLMYAVIGAVVREDTDEIQKNRLIYQSLLSDGALAKVFYDKLPKNGYNDICACMEVMYKSGEADRVVDNMYVPIAAALHMATATQIMMNRPNYLDIYEMDISTFIRNLTVCALLAFGIHIDVIHKYLPDIEKKYGAGLQPEE